MWLIVALWGQGAGIWMKRKQTAIQEKRFKSNFWIPKYDAFNSMILSDLSFTLTGRTLIHLPHIVFYALHQFCLIKALTMWSLILYMSWMTNTLTASAVMCGIWASLISGLAGWSSGFLTQTQIFPSGRQNVYFSLPILMMTCLYPRCPQSTKETYTCQDKLDVLRVITERSAPLITWMLPVYSCVGAVVNGEMN